MAEQVISVSQASKLSNDKLVGKKKKSTKDKYHTKALKVVKKDKRLNSLNKQIKNKNANRS